MCRNRQTGRADKELRFQQLQQRFQNSSSDAYDAADVHYRAAEEEKAEAEEVLVELTEDDFSFGLELDFPPAGSNHSSTRMSVRHSTSSSATSLNTASQEGMGEGVGGKARPRSSTRTTASSFLSGTATSSGTQGGSNGNGRGGKSKSKGKGVSDSFLQGGTPTPPHRLPHAFQFKDYMPKCFRVVRSLAGIEEGDFMMSVAGESVSLLGERERGKVWLGG